MASRAVRFNSDQQRITVAIQSDINDLLRVAGAPIAELHAVGGGARSPIWLQLKADICSIPLRVPQVTEAACLGAALLGGVASGEFADVTAAVNATVRMKQRIEPQPAQTAAYAPRFALYERVYPALRELLWQC